MDRNSIAVSIVSLGAPATSVKDGPSPAAFCRQMNEYAADLCKRHPGRFGFFATVPSFDDTAACIAEIGYALGELKASGVNVLTSYGGHYLGHQGFAPVWDELDRRKAVVFLHPGIESPVDPIAEPAMLPKPIMDWTHETTRTAVHLISTNTLKDHPNVRVVLPHGGGTLPYIANRIAQVGAGFPSFSRDKPAEEFLDEARGLYYDTAFAGWSEPLKLLLDFAKPGHVLYGSDYPFCSQVAVAQQLESTQSVLVSHEPEVAKSVYRGAAAQLWPSLAGLPDGTVPGGC
jgi:predicted TIM-barrel fold metal-dependent hydrolase